LDLIFKRIEWLKILYVIYSCYWRCYRWLIVENHICWIPLSWAKIIESVPIMKFKILLSILIAYIKWVSNDWSYLFHYIIYLRDQRRQTRIHYYLFIIPICPILFLISVSKVLQFFDWEYSIALWNVAPITENARYIFLWVVILPIF